MNFDASAIVSCYKARNFIGHKIDNILQSSAKMQIVIVECANGEEISHIKDHPSIKKIVFKERISVWKAINIGIAASDCELVVQANTDDLVSPDAYCKQIERIEAGFDISYFDYHIVDGYYQTWDKARDASYTHYITPSSGYSIGNGLGMFPMWRKSLHSEVGYFDDNLEVYGDSLFWENLVKHGKKFGKINEILGAYAQRPGQNLEVRLGAKDQEYLKKIK